MTIETVLITRTVEDHAAAIAWYETLLGRPPTGAPVPNCREWELLPGVIFQVIEQPERRGETTFAFGVSDLEAERARLAAGQVPESQSHEVKGFDGLRYVEYSDTENVRTGLLNASKVGVTDPTH